MIWTLSPTLNSIRDTETELPIALSLSPGNTYDGHRATHVLSEAKRTLAHRRPEYVIMDAGYSSWQVWGQIRRRYCSKPVIKPHPRHHLLRETMHRAVPNWEEIYDRRGAVERLFGRLKLHRRLNNITVRGLRRVEAHCYVPMIVMNAMALAMQETPRQVVRAAA